MKNNCIFCGTPSELTTSVLIVDGKKTEVNICLNCRGGLADGKLLELARKAAPRGTTVRLPTFFEVNELPGG